MTREIPSTNRMRSVTLWVLRTWISLDIGIWSFIKRVAFLAPVADAATHGEDIRVAHLLQVVGRQRRAVQVVLSVHA